MKKKTCFQLDKLELKELDNNCLQGLYETLLVMFFKYRNTFCSLAAS